MNQRSPLGYSTRLGPQSSAPRRGASLPIGWIAILGGLFALLVLLWIVGATGATEQADATDQSAELEEIVRPALTRAGYGDIVVRADNRTVVLEGELATRADVVAASAVASSIAEVAYVDNRLTYVGEPELGDIAGDNTPGPVQGGATSSDDLLLQAEMAGIAARDPIEFETGSDELTPESATTIAQIAEALLERPTVRVEIGGHTDSDGEPEANQLLSEARANAVLNSLLAAGIEADRMTAVGYGDARPVDTNETAEGKRRNRRIEFLVVI
jgi:outer membrane protein OmpA-like peptidoglycan-associated protein